MSDSACALVVPSRGRRDVVVVAVVQDAVELFQGRGHPLPPAVVGHQRGHADAHPVSVGHGHLCLPAGSAHVALYLSLPGCHLHLLHRPLHQL